MRSCLVWCCGDASVSPSVYVFCQEEALAYSGFYHGRLIQIMCFWRQETTLALLRNAFLSLLSRQLFSLLNLVFRSPYYPGNAFKI